ncbi:MAG: hypothetical protein EOP11_14615 [Proteobacteria bacterium]|nr:MAG: hypothetical protein EOP11_14615 [Pseudomonadota bacterium]
MSKISKLPPVHFDFRSVWRDEARALCREPKIAEAIEHLEKQWEEIARSKVEGKPPAEGAEEFDLEMHIFRVKRYSWHWLADTFESYSLAELQLAICETLDPKQTWEIAESDEHEHSVVVNADRSLVSDLSLGRKLSAGASLFLAGETDFPGVEAAEKEADAYLSERHTQKVAQLQLLERHLERYGKGGTVEPLRSEKK